MKKILLITPRYPFPILGGDKDRFVGIAKTLEKNIKSILFPYQPKIIKKITKIICHIKL